MGCGCKKAAKLSEPIRQPAQITVSVDQAQASGQTTTTLNEGQQQVVDSIIEKLRQINQ